MFKQRKINAVYVSAEKKIIDEPMLLMAAQHPLLKMDTKQLKFFCNVPEYPYVCVNDAQNLILAYTIFTLCVILKQSFIQAGRQKVAKTGEA